MTGVDGLQRGAWLPVQGRGLVFVTDDMVAAHATATDTAVRVAVDAERVRLLTVLRGTVIATDLGDAVLTRSLADAFRPAVTS